jgi:NADP-dependent 3-hydroxy acid dehydrogenase YdfG
MTTRNDTHGKVAVVTGASSGIGAATARALVADGYRVALLARRLDRISSLADELGNGSVAIEADVTDRGSIVAAADRVRQELGNADVLINNAGVMLLGPFDSDQRDDYRQMIEVNLLGAITTTEVFLDQVKDAGGDIINISSVAGRTARSGNGVYAATKWGINGWSESLRQELLPDVRVTLVEPGVVATELPNHITHADTKHGVQQLYDKAEVTTANWLQTEPGVYPSDNNSCRYPSTYGASEQSLLRLPDTTTASNPEHPAPQPEASTARRNYADLIDTTIGEKPTPAGDPQLTQPQIGIIASSA